MAEENEELSDADAKLERRRARERANRQNSRHPNVGNLSEIPGAVTGENPNAPLKYNLPEIEARRNSMGEQIWRAVAEGRLNLSNQGQLANFLTSIGLLDKKEEGRHMRKMFLGGLDEEGWGMGDSGYGRALDEYRPNWSRMVSGLQKDPKTGLYSSGGGRWYDAFGRLAKTDPVQTPTSTPTSTPNVPPPPMTNTNPNANPNINAVPTPNPAFYGGTNAPSPYGTGQANTRMTRQQVTANRTRPSAGQARPNQVTPAWYSTWRF